MSSDFLPTDDRSILNNKRCFSLMSAPEHDVMDSNKDRIVEIELLSKTKPCVFQLEFLDTPSWLFTLDPQLVSHLYIPQYKNQDHLLATLSNKGINTYLVQRVLVRYSSIKIIYWKKPSDSEIYVILVSGNLSFIVPYL